MPLSDTGLRQENVSPWLWSTSGATEFLSLNAYETANLGYFQVGSVGDVRILMNRFSLDSFSRGRQFEAPRVFLSWSASGRATQAHRFNRLAELVEGIRLQTVPEASDELWELIDRATELRDPEPGTDEEIDAWASRLTNQVIDADD